MKITIIGWYGTETIGDRAILAGILKCIGDRTQEIYLGSIYPFFTERTIFEDSDFYERYLNVDKSLISIFDSKKSNELEKMIDSSDTLILGGGPLMHIGPMHMVNYAFKYAKRKNKRTILLGNGVGPIFSKKFEKVLIEIVSNSDDIVLRDSVSLSNLENIFKKYSKPLDKKGIKIAYDPSLIAILEYLKKNKKREEQEKGEILVNLRKFPREYTKCRKKIKQIDQYIHFFINELDRTKKQKIKLLPNHYFFIGGDDRDFYNDLKFENKFKNITVQNEPLNLEQTFEKILNADLCFGMRFHAIIFQTLLNGRNFVLDYTEPNKGKIIGFLKDVNFDMERYINLQNINKTEKIINLINNNFCGRTNLDINHKKLEIFYDLFK
jgi:polysaccharide pyruvyl transferase WcaK-like protein